MTTSKEIEIKFHGWHKVTLTENTITGNTFEVKEFIKKYLGGKWNQEAKGWDCDPALLEKRFNGTEKFIMVK